MRHVTHVVPESSSHSFTDTEVEETANAPTIFQLNAVRTDLFSRLCIYPWPLVWQNCAAPSFLDILVESVPSVHMRSILVSMAAIAACLLPGQLNCSLLLVLQHRCNATVSVLPFSLPYSPFSFLSLWISDCWTYISIAVSQASRAVTSIWYMYFAGQLPSSITTWSSSAVATLSYGFQWSYSVSFPLKVRFSGKAC